MGRNIKQMYTKVEGSFNNPTHAKQWQGGVGILVMVVFVLSSVLFNKTVQALNRAAGNYGYYQGTYGYNASVASSDFVPSAPTTLTTSGSTATATNNASITLAWTAPTLTTGSTSLDNLSSYKIHYGTSSLSSCSGGTSATSTSASKELTDLTASTTYFVAVCALDSPGNTSAALTGSFTTASVTAGSVGGGGQAGSVGSGVGTTTTTVVVTPVAPVAQTAGPIVTTSISSTVVANAAQLVAQLGVTRNTSAESANVSKVASSATEFKVTVGAEVKTVAANFVTYGTTNASVKALGSGERLALVRDMLETLGVTVGTDSRKFLLAAEQISSGQKPTVRNLASEQKKVPQALDAFKKLTGRRPNFKNANDDLAWNTLMYRIRFKRDVKKESAGIAAFKRVYGTNPKSPFDWAVVRAAGYQLGK